MEHRALQAWAQHTLGDIGMHPEPWQSREAGAPVPGSPHHMSCPGLWLQGLQGPPQCKATVFDQELNTWGGAGLGGSVS